MTTFDPYAPSRDTTEGKVFSVTGGDWDSLVQDIGATKEERVVVNMGPQHPSTHGVLRLVLELEGETVTEARCGIVDGSDPEIELAETYAKFSPMRSALK